MGNSKARISERTPKPNQKPRSPCNPEDFSWKEGTRRRRRTAAATSRGVSQGATPCPRRRKLTRWFPISPLRESLSSPVMSLSYREFIECRYIGLFRISNSISYRTSHIEYLDILKTNDFFVFFRRKFQKFAENSENSPKIRRKFAENSENSENSPKIQKILKIRRKFLKKKVFFEA